ncbi:MAG: adventurous gliding motility lipoprotein CglC [Myxococcales bacterium]
MQPNARRVASVVLSTVAALSFACARSDLGAPCHLQDANGAELRPQPGREYLYLGSSECESFACLATPGTSGGYCSQACTSSGASCPSGLTCRQLALDPAYLEVMKERLPPDRFQALFGQLTSSSFCAKP